MLKALIFITLKETVVDPQGLVVKHALESLGFSDVNDVRCGKIITLQLKLKNKKKAQGQVEAMCKSLLANPIIENYRIKINKD